MSTRNPWLDAIKALACLAIVGHHLAFYGPMADVVRTAAPGLIQSLRDYGRWAVAVFLVIGGYWSAAALAPHAQPRSQAFWPPLAKRFLRLSLPYSAALICAIAVNETVRHLGFDHASVSATPSWSSVAAHLLLLHSLGGWESLSAGVWYVAIDFQLFALCWLWFWLCAQHAQGRRIAAAGMVLLTALSLFHWNLDARWDVWGLYFVGSYGLGMLAWWSAHSASQQQRRAWLALLLTLGCTALWWAWRDRLAVALTMAVLLALAGARSGPRLLLRVPGWQLLRWLGERAYSIFLIHFPMGLLVSAEVSQSWPDNVAANAIGMGVAVLLAVMAGDVLYELTERVPARWSHLLAWHSAALATGALAWVLHTW